MRVDYVIVASETDPVAQALSEKWGTPPSIGAFVDGAALRRLGPSSLLVKRPVPHIRDEHLDARLPSELRTSPTTLVFPSIHRSQQGVAALTVHPLGNPGPEAQLGGRPRTLVPAAPALMTATLRSLSEGSGAAGLPVSFEATHHGPELELPAFFVEIGSREADPPSPEAVRLLSRSLVRLAPYESDRVAMGVGGGHYAPHFSELALRRHWAFGHILSRHAVEVLDARTAEAAYRATPNAEGILFSRAEDARQPMWQSVGARLRDGDAAERRRPVSVKSPEAPRSR